MEMKLSSRKQLLKESELTLKSIKKSLNESNVFGNLVYKLTKSVVDKIASDKEVLILFVDKTFETIENGLKQSGADPASEKVKTAKDIIKQIEMETRKKVESNSLTSIFDITKYVNDRVRDDLQKHMPIQR
jgi:hypothetical protein